MLSPPRIDVAGTLVSPTTYEEACALCIGWAKSRENRYVCVTSVHGVVEARRDFELRLALNDADLVTPDGMPIVWALRSFGRSKQERVYGPTLMLHICESAAREGISIFLYGALPQTLSALKVRLANRFPRLQIAGVFAPPFRPLADHEEEDIRQRIKASGAQIVFVGLGVPKQEKWMHAHRSAFEGVTMIGVGAAFDFYAGRTRQAPPWMQRNGLEWLFRLVTEPRRLWRRYLLITPKFLPLWFGQWIKVRRKALQ